MSTKKVDLEDPELARRLQTFGIARRGRPRKDSQKVTYAQLGLSKRTAARMRLLRQISEDEIDLVATRQLTLKALHERVFGVQPAKNQLFAAWRRASRAQRDEFLDTLEKAFAQARFFAERERE